MPPSYEINSIARAAEILKCLSNGVNKLTEISRRLDVNKASIHRIMKTLESKGLVSQDPSTRKYYMGPLIQTLAANPLKVHQIVVQLALPEIGRLRDLSHETVVLQIRRGGQRFVLEKEDSRQVIRYFPQRTETAPIHAGAGGKVLLAGLEAHELARLLDRINLTKVGPNTITDKSKLVADLEKIRRQGYAISFGETIEGAAAIAAPIHNYSCPVALVIVGPDSRIKTNKDSILREILISAKHISTKIGTITGIKMAH